MFRNVLVLFILVDRCCLLIDILRGNNNRMSLLTRVNSTWVREAGEYSEPRFVFVTDNIAKELVNNMKDFGVEERDKLVSVCSGKFDDAEQYFREHKARFEGVEAVVVLWYGMEELSQHKSLFPAGISVEVVRMGFSWVIS